MSDGMFHYDPAMTDLIIEACRERLSMDPVSLDFGGLASSLEAELAGLMGPEGTTRPRCSRSGPTPWRWPWCRVTARASSPSSRPRRPRRRSSSTCSSRAPRSTAPPGWKRRASSWPRIRPWPCSPAKPASPRARRVLRGRGLGREPLGSHGRPRYHGTSPAGRSTAPSADRHERGRPLLGRQGLSCARCRHLPRTHPRPSTDWRRVTGRPA